MEQEFGDFNDYIGRGDYDEAMYEWLSGTEAAMDILDRVKWKSRTDYEQIDGRIYFK